MLLIQHFLHVCLLPSNSIKNYVPSGTSNSAASSSEGSDTLSSTVDRSMRVVKSSPPSLVDSLKESLLNQEDLLRGAIDSTDDSRP